MPNKVTYIFHALCYVIVIFNNNNKKKMMVVWKKKLCSILAYLILYLNTRKYFIKIVQMFNFKGLVLCNMDKCHLLILNRRTSDQGI